MIITNGKIEMKIKTGGGLGADGYPVSHTVSWGLPIPCQFRANKYNNKGRTNGEAFTIASYEILIEEQPLTSECVRLSDDAGNVMGEFSVISSEPLVSVCQIKILV